MNTNSNELAWKTMRDYLEHMGIIDKTGSPIEIYSDIKNEHIKLFEQLEQKLS